MKLESVANRLLRQIRNGLFTLAGIMAIPVIGGAIERILEGLGV